MKKRRAGFTSINSKFAEMENDITKCYTPTIEEFHVGFEYEILAVDGNKKDNSDWNKFIFGIYDIYEFDCEGWNDNLKEYISLKSVRVKYLDKQDIESLGFLPSNHNKSIFIFNKMISILPHLPKTTIGINFNEGIKHILIFNAPNEQAFPSGVNLFVGNIKNKSELKRILTQLNIINNS